MAVCLKCRSKYNSWTESYGDGLCLSCHQATLDEEKRKKEEENRQLSQSTRAKIDAIVDAMTEEEPLSVTFINWKLEKKMGSLLKKLPGLAAGVALGGAGGEMLFGGTLLSKSDYTYEGELGILIVTENKIIIGHTTAHFQDEAGSIGPGHIQLLSSQCDSAEISRWEFDIKHTQIGIQKTGLGKPELLESGKRLVLENYKDSLTCNWSHLLMDPSPYELASFDSIYSRVEKIGALCTPYKFVCSLEENKNPLAEHHVNYIIENKTYIREVTRLIYYFRTIPQANLSSLNPLIKTAIYNRLKFLADSYQRIRLMLFGSILLTTSFISGIIFSNDKDWRTFFIIACIISGILAIILWFRLKHVVWCHKFLDSKNVG